MINITNVTVISNMQLIWIITTGVLLLHQIFLASLYYIFLEKSKTVLYHVLFMFSILSGLIFDSFVTVDYVKNTINDTTKILESGSLLANYMVMVTLMGLVLFQSEESERKLVWLSLISVPIVFTISLIIGQETICYMVFVLMTMSYTIYQLFVKFVDMDKNLKTIFGFYAVGTLIFTSLDQLNIVTKAQYNPMRLIGSVVSFLLLVVYFMQRYNTIQKQKYYLYERLRRDHLTGAYSKAYFLSTLKKVDHGTVMFIDINKFKWINDNLGHGVADQILIDFATNLMTLKSKVITPARYGGDEFSIIFAGYTIAETMENSNRIIEAFKNILDFYVDDYPPEVGISIGISNIQIGKIDSTIGYADRLMYIAKGEGNYRVITQEMIEEVIYE